jgi:hypothetical protein
MTSLRNLLGSATIAALLMTSSAPALARPGWGGHHGGHYGGYRHYRGHGDGFGNFLLGALVVGGVVAIASAASKDRQQRAQGGTSYPDARAGQPVYSDDEDRRDWTDAENAAANVCADAAERVTSKEGSDSRVDDIDRINRDGEGYRIDGRLQDGRTFNCGVRYGELTFIQFADRVALR